MQDQGSFSGRGQAQPGQGYQGGAGARPWSPGDRPGRSVIHTTFEIANPRDAEQIASAAVQVPGIGFKTYQDEMTGRQKVTLTITRQAAQRLQQVQALHQQLLALSLGGNSN